MAADSDPSPAKPEPGRNGEPESEFDDEGARETFGPTIDAIRSAWSTESIASSPQSGDWEPFRLYWYHVFTKILSQVEADPEIPQYMTDPPCPKFEVMIFRLGDYNPGCCPCVLPECTPNITIKNKDGGVTKGEVVKAVRDYLYGEHLKEGPKVWKAQKEIEEAERNEEHGFLYREVGEWKSEEEGMTMMRKPVVWNSEWMTGGWIDPEDHSKGQECMYGSAYGKVWLYVCEAEEYEEKDNSKPDEYEDAEGGEVEGENAQGQEGVE
ncbi:hypothetical protein QBC44DRAFT_385658 [Cladorrhinum sp. PSN332]|nr:hypothetical protein QBC44DRAFT_385658 [Cladorrhinum sp. PSN332]